MSDSHSSYCAVLLVAVADFSLVTVGEHTAVQKAADGQHQFYYETKQRSQHAHGTVPHPDVLTNVGGGSVSVGKLVELPGSHGVHLDERDAAAAPLPL